MSVWILSPRGGTCCGCKPAVCDNCSGACAAPTLVCDSVSASKTKCGFGEFTSPSTPPKIYTDFEQSGVWQNDFNTGANLYRVKNTYSGGLFYTPFTCALSDTRSMSAYMELGPDVGNCNSTFGVTMGEADIEAMWEFLWSPFPGCDVTSDPPTSISPAALSCAGYIGSIVTTPTSIDYSAVAPACGLGSSTLRIDLNSEFTTASLIADTEAALPAYPGTFTGTCSSYRNLSTDELTYTIRRFKYKFILPYIVGCSAYSIDWMEGTTPRNYTWNGTDTETPVYGAVFEPNSNGTVTITDVTYSCTC